MRRRNQSIFLCLMFLAILVIAFFSAPSSTEAYVQACQYQNTQARVQPNVNTPLTQYLNLKCGESFLVGSFHNESGVWATDTLIDVTSVNGYRNLGVVNGTKIVTNKTPGTNDTYFVHVRTKGPNGSIQPGSACFAFAQVNVSCPAPTPDPRVCPYQSVQARVKLPGAQPWVKSLSLFRGDVFEVGGFYDNSGVQIPDDQVKIVVTDPRGNRTTNLKNNHGYKTYFPGTYEIKVRVKGQADEDCTETINVQVQRKWAR